MCIAVDRSAPGPENSNISRLGVNLKRDMFSENVRMPLSFKVDESSNIL